MSSEALQSWVDEAVAVAMLSPCQSKRGVVIANRKQQLISTGFNSPPPPFICDGSERCKMSCGKAAIHAEQRAILSVVGSPHGGWMLHVKAKAFKPVASGNPSCLECSKLILASGIDWMHLLHDPVAQVLPGAVKVGECEGILSSGETGPLEIRRYSAAHFHWLTAEYFHRIQLVMPGATK